MQAALVDTTVLYAAGNRTSHPHDRALEIVRAADEGRLPVLRIPDVVLVGTMNGLGRDVGHATATHMLDRLEASTGFSIDRVTDAIWHSGVQVFRTVDRLSLADGLVVSVARNQELEYLYSFDGDFEGIEGVTRLKTATDPVRFRVKGAR